MFTLTLPKHEWRMILAALEAVSPSGGGSAPYTLCLKIIDETKLVADDREVCGFQLTAHAEAEIHCFGKDG